MRTSKVSLHTEQPTGSELAQPNAISVSGLEHGTRGSNAPPKVSVNLFKMNSVIKQCSKKVTASKFVSGEPDYGTSTQMGQPEMHRI